MEMTDKEKALDDCYNKARELLNSHRYESNQVRKDPFTWSVEIEVSLHDIDLRKKLLAFSRNYFDYYELPKLRMWVILV